MTDLNSSASASSIIAIHSADKELTAPEGHIVVLVRGNAKAGRAAQQVIIPQFDLNDVPAIYHGMLKEALLGEVRSLVKSAKTASIQESQVSAAALASEWNAKNVEIDWAKVSETLGEAMEAFLKASAPTFPQVKINTLVKGKLAQFKMFVTGIKAGVIDAGIFTAVNATLAKLLAWDDLIAKVPAAMDAMEIIEKASQGCEVMTADDILG